jgi:hypothetical protein
VNAITRRLNKTINSWRLPTHDRFDRGDTQVLHRENGRVALRHMLDETCPYCEEVNEKTKEKNNDPRATET